MSAIVERPAEFDAKIMAFYPGLLNHAWKLTRDRERQIDLVGDTVAMALHRWQSYNEKYSIWTWLKYTMQEIRRDRARESTRQIKTVVPSSDEDSYMPATQGNQFDSANLASVLRTIGQIKNGGHIIRRAMGDTFREIGAKGGNTSQCAHLQYKEAMADLRRAVAVAA